VNLAIFDIDDTLTRTMEVDSSCYVQAFADVLGIRRIDTDWSAYEHTTDSWIAPALIRRHLRREAEPVAIEDVRNRFVALLQAAHARRPETISAMPGATSLLMALRASADWAIAIATGGWGSSARFKLEAAGLDVREATFACADDADTRHEIVRCAMERAAQSHDLPRFDRVVSIGDAVWDVKTAARLELPFIGIAEHEQARRLAPHGADLILPHFEPVDAFLSALQRAPKPRVVNETRRPTPTVGKPTR
jgi:phosphoglycolate phosphatase-like HAD superfamily hydrolase